MKITFFGTRGSTPVSGDVYRRFGGNTTCIAIEAGDRLYILDCGTGLLGLQRELFDTQQYAEADIFISHMHWDHIQGVAFFAPFYQQDKIFRVYSEKRDGANIKEQMDKVMTSPMFPVGTETFQADFMLHTFACGDTFQLGELKIETARLQHPDVCTGYRFTWENKSVCIISDCEQADSKAEALAENTDILIYDGQYTPEEYGNKRGWGHSTWEAGCELASKTRAGQLVLTHHDPFRTDGQLMDMEEKARAVWPGTRFAYDGMTIYL